MLLCWSWSHTSQGSFTMLGPVFTASALPSPNYRSEIRNTTVQRQNNFITTGETSWRSFLKSLNAKHIQNDTLLFSKLSFLWRVSRSFNILSACGLLSAERTRSLALSIIINTTASKGRKKEKEEKKNIIYGHHLHLQALPSCSYLTIRTHLSCAIPTAVQFTLNT